MSTTELSPNETIAQVDGVAVVDWLAKRVEDLMEQIKQESGKQLRSTHTRVLQTQVLLGSW